MASERTHRLVDAAIALLFVLNACWMLWIPAFPTLDGWTHLHTASMLFNGAPEGVYCPNPGPVPNRIGHLVLGALAQVLPALVAERAMLALIMLVSGTGLWALARSLGRSSPLILLALPFTVNFMLALGFHNFLLGVGLAFLFSAHWMRGARVTWPRLAHVLIASLVLFYTHTTALALYLLLLAAFETAMLPGPVKRESTLPGGRWGTAAAVGLACLPAVFLLLDFNAAQKGTWGTTDPATQLRDLFDLRSIVLYHYGEEGKFTYTLKLLLVAAGAIAAIARYREGARQRTDDILLATAAVLTMLYFLLPDSSGYASYISVRLQWMAILLFIAWVANQRIPLLAIGPLVVMVLLVHEARNGYISKAMAPLADRTAQVLDIARHLPEGSTVLAVSSEGNWLLGHAASLLAVERQVTLLDNYECGTGYFPYVWCGSLPTPLREHMGRVDGCMEWLPAYVQDGIVPRLDRIVLLGYEWNPNHCRSSTLRQVLVRHYRKGASNPYASVYELVR